MKRFIAITSAIVALAAQFASAAGAETSSNMARIQYGGADCPTCQFVIESPIGSTPRVVATGSMRTFPGLFLDVYAGQRVYNPQGNTYMNVTVPSAGALANAWARKACVGSSGFKFSSTIYQKAIVPNRNGFSGMWWRTISISSAAGCHL